jgi:hypothetical protein
MTRPGLPVPIPNEVFFSAELSVTCKGSFIGIVVVEIVGAGAAVCAREAAVVAGMIVGPWDGEGVVRVDGIVWSELRALCVDVHPVKTMHAARTIITAEQITNLVFFMDS